jgi:hypothetical protein
MPALARGADAGLRALGRRPKASKGGNRGPEGALATRGADYGDLAHGFAADESGGGVGVRQNDVGWRMVRVKRLEMGRIDQLRRDGEWTGESCRPANDRR